RHRDQIRGEQRKNHRQRERHEKEFAHAIEKYDREENDDSGERGGEYRQRDFVSAAFGGDFGRFAHFQVPENIFQHDDGIVNQPRKRQRQSAENHRVDGAVAHGQRDKRGERGKRNRKKHRERCPHTAEKNQNHQAGQHKADQTFMNQIFNGVAHEDGLVEDNFRHELPGYIKQVSDRILDAVHDRDGVRVTTLFQHRQINRWLAVHAHDVVLDFRTVHGVADIADEHGSVANGFQRHLVDV